MTLTSEDFRSPFSPTFRANLASMSEKLDSIEERFSQIEKSAAEIQRFFSSAEAASGSQKFVELQTTGWSPSAVGDVSANEYQGISFHLEWENGAFVKVNEQGCRAFDLSVKLNEPTQMPDPAIITGADGLEEDTVVLGVEISDGIVAFCSNRPRLKVTCE